MSLADKKYEKDHLHYLDSARGIAAMMVLMGHFINWKYQNSITAKLCSLVFNANDAVSFFFVLSGFVLSYKYVVQDKSLDIAKYFVNRCARLFPAFIITVALNAIYLYRNDLHLKTLSGLFVYNKLEFWEEIYLFRAKSKFFVAGWTLFTELTLSFLMPFMIALAKKDRKLILWLVLTFTLIGGINGFCVHFSLGLLLAAYFDDIRDISFKKTWFYRYRYLLIVAGYLLFSIRQLDRISPLGSTMRYLMEYFGLNFFFCTGLGSFIFLAAILQSPRAQKILQNKILVFYGRISYGIYLMHWLVVVVIFEHWERIAMHFANNNSAMMVMMLVCIGVSTLLATILHYTIELPFMSYGKKLIKKMKPSLIIP